MKKILFLIPIMVIALLFTSCATEVTTTEQEANNTDLAYKIAYYLNDFGSWAGDNITESTTTNGTGWLFANSSDIDFKTELISNDDILQLFGTDGDSFVEYETADIDAKCVYIGLPITTYDANNVPMLVIGDRNIKDVDLGMFAGVSSPHLAMIDTDRDSFTSIGHLFDDVGNILSNRPLAILANGDTDDYLKIATVSNIPTIYGSGSYLRVGDAYTSLWGISGEDSFLVTGEFECANTAYFSQPTYTYYRYFSDGTGLWLENVTANTTNGVSITSYKDDSVPSDNDNIYSHIAYGNNDADEQTQYGKFNFLSTDVSDGTENGKLEYWLIDDGVQNLVMYVNSAGDLYIDGTPNTFDDYNDAELLKQSIGNQEMDLLVSAGIATKTGDKYKINLQKMINLVAGSTYQNYDKIELQDEMISMLCDEIDYLVERIETLESLTK